MLGLLVRKNHYSGVSLKVYSRDSISNMLCPVWNPKNMLKCLFVKLFSKCWFKKQFVTFLNEQHQGRKFWLSRVDCLIFSDERIDWETHLPGGCACNLLQISVFLLLACSSCHNSLKDGWRYQSRWITRKVPNVLLFKGFDPHPPPLRMVLFSWNHVHVFHTIWPSYLLTYMQPYPL